MNEPAYTVLRLLLVTGLCAALSAPMVAHGQKSGELPAIYEGAGLDEQLGEQLPLDVVLQDESGQDVVLGSLFPDDRPVLLNFVYYDCPMLCSILLDGMTNALGQMEWTPGKEFEVITISFSAREDAELAREAWEKFASRLQDPQARAGWHFLTGSEAAIEKLTSATGFQFKWAEKQQQYVHPAAIMFASPGGKITRYLHGLEFDPRDIRTAVVEASEGRVGSALDQVILFCFQYDPESGSYVPYAINIMKLGGLLTLFVLGGLLFFFWRRESRQLEAPHAAHAASEWQK